MHSSTDIRDAKDIAAQPLRPYRDRLLRLADVKHMTGLGRSSIYAGIQAKSFPAAVNLTAHAVAWRESDIDAWIATRPAAVLPFEPPAPPAPASAKAAPSAKAPSRRAKASTTAARSRP
ncbi:AlpA family phage regulatory protein [Acidovorax sp.]|uniref:helix-turn-helix transcriptional regulator n=1 Tax=Acidovorax sp. TaxID=1872122 RepID=UPI0031DC0728